MSRYLEIISVKFVYVKVRSMLVDDQSVILVSL